MTLRQYLTLMLVGTALSWGAVALIVTMINPTGSPSVVFAVFYISTLTALTGTFSVMGLLSRVTILGKKHHLSRQVAVSFRQAIMLSLLAIGVLFLQSHSMLSWWNAALMVAVLTVLESFFISTANRIGKS
jgi:hypothetical protein